MRHAFLVILALSAAIFSGQPAGCETAGSIPCYTLRMAYSNWSFFREGWTDVVRSGVDRLEALRADGSRASVWTGSEFHLFGADLPPDPASRQLFLKPSGRSVLLDARRRRAFFRLADELEAPADPACAAAAKKENRWGNDVILKVVGAGTRLGQHVVRWSYEHQDPHTRAFRVVEFAPNLGCAVLFSRESWGRRDSWLPERIATSQAFSLKLGEPDPSLFLVPADYRLVGDVPPPPQANQPAGLLIDAMAAPLTLPVEERRPLAVPLFRLVDPQIPPLISPLVPPRSR